jgi:uncharacterized protein
LVLDLRKLFLNDGESQAVNCEFDFSEVEIFGGYPLKQPVKLKGLIENRAGVVEFRCDCVVTYDAPCDRCYVDTVGEYVIPVVKTLVHELENEDDDEFLLLKDYKLDVKELCYEEVIPNLPSKHLCNPNCKGVCQKCGKNLNQGECDCETETVDPRLQKLKELLKD